MNLKPNEKKFKIKIVNMSENELVELIKTQVKNSTRYQIILTELVNRGYNWRLIVNN
jgi:hypothetical protein